MKSGFYAKMAWTGMRKNKRLYTPYILTCIGMVMMFYIVSFLTSSSVLAETPGGNTMQAMLGMGCAVIGVFALLFLFYTNSFLVRRRKKEFGLYNILGMGKWNVGRILLWESVMIAVISLLGGLVAGIVFSKFAELGMVNLLKADVTFTMSLEPGAIRQTITLFLFIFLLILLNTLRQLHLTNPIELLHSESAGEKPPRANFLLALVGAVILGAAYYLAITIDSPMEAIIWFFVAVVMVIIATYLLFIAGSVAICRILQKKKSYYYKTNHFVSVSSMVYRMKRNGAGLASICILCTMVLVMMTATVCLYVGTEDSLRSRYPRNINLDATLGSMEQYDSDQMEQVRALAVQAAGEGGQTAENILDYNVAAFTGTIEDDRIRLDTSGGLNSYSSLWQIFIVSLEDYNKLMGQNETLALGEVLVYTTKSDYAPQTIAVGDGQVLNVRKNLEEFADNGVDAMQVIPSIYIFVPDFVDFVNPLLPLVDSKGRAVLELHWYYGFDMEGSDDIQIAIQERLEAQLAQLSLTRETGAAGGFWVACEGVAKERTGFYGLYGGLFFLGILLGLVFIFAAVLIVYYKQISEGYEDQSRFEIMQKVGMTQKEIRRSINSQILTVFFLPLIAAGIHLGFAFPMIYRMLVLFGLLNLKLLLLVTGGCFLVFALFYMVVYRITSRAYYSIVSGAKGRE